MKKVLIVLALSGFLLASCGEGDEVSDNENILSDEDQALIESVTAVIPPDPGEAGKATLAGIDSDNDGVRDDLERYVVEEQPNTNKNVQAKMLFHAKTFTSLMARENLTKDDVKEMLRAEKCLTEVHNDENDNEILYLAEIGNTKERILKQYRLIDTPIKLDLTEAEAITCD